MIAFGKAVLRKFALGCAGVAVGVLALVGLRQADQAADAARCDDLIAAHAVDACWVVDEDGIAPGGAR